MNDYYTQLHNSLKRLKGGKEQKISLFFGIVMSIVLLPIGYIFFYIPIHSIWNEIIKVGFYQWINSWDPASGLVMGFAFIIGFMILWYIFSGVATDIRTILLLKELEKFNISWKDSQSRVQRLDEILSGIESIHKNLYSLPVLKKYAYAKDSKYLFLQETEIKYFYSILTDLRSDLQLRLTEQQKTLEQAKSEVEANIHGTTELEQVSELQRARLNQQIEQFEELQKVLVKV